MSYIKPTLTQIQGPSLFSPAYAPNWFAFQGNYGSASNITLYAQVDILSQFDNYKVLETAGRFKVPVRDTTLFSFDSSQIIKTYLTYPYNKLLPTGTLAVYPNRYVNETSGFGSPTLSFPTVAPEADGLVEYDIKYGLEYTPGITFSSIWYPGGATQTIYYIQGSKIFCETGDVLQIGVNSNLFSYFSGEVKVLNIATNSLGQTLVYTNKTPNLTLLGITNNITGTIMGVQHQYGTTSIYYAYNGTRQWEEKNINFSNIYMVRQQGYTYSLFPSTSTQSNFQFMNDWGTTQSQAIPIKQGQAERVRFLADLTIPGANNGPFTQRLAFWAKDVYNSSGTLVSTTTHSIDDSPGGTMYPNKCFTLQVFDGTETIQDGFYYKFTLRSYRTNLTVYDWASIWYVGDTKCSQYENFRLKFLNRQGSWAYWNFNKDNKKTSEISRTEFKSPYQYDYTPTAQVTNKNNIVSQLTTSTFTLGGLRGQQTLSISSIDTFTLNSDWITEEQCNYLQQLVTSPQVFIYYDTYTYMDGSVGKGVNIPINITDTSYVFKTINRDRIFNMTINYKYSYDTNLQNP